MHRTDITPTARARTDASRRSRWTSAGCGVLLLVIMAASPTATEAQDVAKAAEAFQQAQSAELRGDHAFAAEMYEVAHRTAPSPQALRSAMRARKAAGQPALAATHALRVLERYGDDEESRKRAEAVLEELEGQLLRVAVGCPDAPCTLAVDGGALGLPADTEQEFFVEPGSHEISAAVGDAAAPAQSVEGEGGERRELTFEQPDPEPQPASAAEPSADADASSGGPAEGTAGPSSPEPATSSASPPAAPTDRADDGGLHPAVFITGLAVTAGFGAATTWAALDTEQQADDYREEPTPARYDNGQDRQRQTNAFIGATAAAGVATALIGIFWTDWSGEPDAEHASERPSVRVASSGREAVMFVEGSF